MHVPRYRLFVAAFIVGAISLLVPLHYGANAFFWERLIDVVHIPFFAGVTWLFTVTNPLGIVGHRPRLIAAILLSVFGAAAVEIIQPLTHREESFSDFANGVFGIFLAGFAFSRRSGRPSCLARLAWMFAAVAGIAFSLMPAWHEARGLIWRARNFPLLADFESDDEMRLWFASGLDPDDWNNYWMGRTNEWPAHGSSGLTVNLSKGIWPGVRVLTGGQDWHGYSAFAFDLFNTGAPFELTVRIDDTAGQNEGGRFSKALPIRSGWNHVRIPLTEIQQGTRGRPLHVASIQSVVFFRDHPTDTRTLHLDYLRLE